MGINVNKANGFIATTDAYDGTWVDSRGNTRVTKLEADGDYNIIREKRDKKRKAANRSHARWCKQFMRESSED